MAVTAPVTAFEAEGASYLRVSGEAPGIPPFWGLWTSSAPLTAEHLVDGILFNWGSRLKDAGPFLSVDVSTLQEVRVWELGSIRKLTVPIPDDVTFRHIEPERPPALLAASPMGVVHYYGDRVRRLFRRRR